jgi:hypothetical protein
MDIIWHPICDPIDIEPFEDNKISWIKPFLCPPFLKTDQPYRKFNDFIEGSDIVDNDYYCFIGDDDMFEEGFFDVIRQQTSKILINSCYRGDVIPDGGIPRSRHPIYPLIMRELENIHYGNIGLGMFTIKGEILKQTRFIAEPVSDDTAYCFGDGLYAENLKNKWPNEIKFLTNLFVLGNYFQPGRYTENSKNNFIKLKNFLTR